MYNVASYIVEVSIDDFSSLCIVVTGTIHH